MGDLLQESCVAWYYFRTAIPCLFGDSLLHFGLKQVFCFSSVYLYVMLVSPFPRIPDRCLGERQT